MCYLFYMHVFESNQVHFECIIVTACLHNFKIEQRNHTRQSMNKEEKKRRRRRNISISYFFFFYYEFRIYQVFCHLSDKWWKHGKWTFVLISFLHFKSKTSEAFTFLYFLLQMFAISFSRFLWRRALVHNDGWQEAEWCL